MIGHLPRDRSAAFLTPGSTPAAHRADRRHGRPTDAATDAVDRRTKPCVHGREMGVRGAQTMQDVPWSLEGEIMCRIFKTCHFRSLNSGVLQFLESEFRLLQASSNLLVLVHRPCRSPRRPAPASAETHVPLVRLGDDEEHPPERRGEGSQSQQEGGQDHLRGRNP